MTVFIETAPHEFSANYLFNERGLFPYFAADNRASEAVAHSVARSDTTVGSPDVHRSGGHVLIYHSL